MTRCISQPAGYRDAPDYTRCQFDLPPPEQKTLRSGRLGFGACKKLQPPFLEAAIFPRFVQFLDRKEYQFGLPKDNNLLDMEKHESENDGAQ
jgi:hypothetical protein